jgi:hypothetical protein
MPHGVVILFSTSVVYAEEHHSTTAGQPRIREDAISHTKHGDDDCYRRIHEVRGAGKRRGGKRWVRRTSGAVAEGLGDALGRPAQALAAVVLAEPQQQRAHRRLHGVARRRGVPGEQAEVVAFLVLLARARGGHEVGLLERSHGGGGIHCPRRLLLGREAAAK